MKTLDRKTWFVAACLCGSLAGCASTRVPTELMDAREAYNRVSQGQAAKLTPAELYEAKQALDRAERAYADDADDAKDLAYIAERKAELVDSHAGTAAAAYETSAAQADLKAALADRARTSEAELAAREGDLQRAQTEIAAGRQQIASEQQRVADAKKETEVERKARKEAERVAQAAMASLQQVASVKEEARGMVITLSGAVLFASGQSTLLPIAQEKLNQVADALKGSPNQNIVIEGHTDSVGSDSSNQELALRRAQAVRDYLVSQGLPADRVRAAGIGAARPVADNKSAEGRANNRRVEIIVEPKR
jgi:outer membrane protein OmpA-like peptidoglycan-associated protein